MSTIEVVEVGERTSDKPVGVMLHGFGGSAESTAPLCDIFLNIIPYWLVIQAPIPLEKFLGYPGYAWFPKNPEALFYESGFMWHDLESYDAPDIAESTHLINECLHERHIFSSSPVVLGGFSQGGLMASELVLQSMQGTHNAGTSDYTYAGLILFSSAFMAGQRWRALIQTSTQAGHAVVPPVMVAHGKDDAVLLYKQGRALYDFWKHHSRNAEFCEFDGGHEIPDAVCHATRTFLQKHVL